MEGLCCAMALQEEKKIKTHNKHQQEKLVWLTEKGKSWVRAAIMQHVDTSFRIG